MKPCSDCHRPLVSTTRACPFCGVTLSTRWLKVAAGAVVAPFVLSACYGQPPCEAVDNDGDGSFACVDGTIDRFGNDDCDDTDPTVNPGAEEVCDDGVDNNCDGILAGTEQLEVCGNELDDDCDGEADELAEVPGVEAVCGDGLDDDCDGLADFDDPDCDEDSDLDTDIDSDSDSAQADLGSMALSIVFEGPDSGLTCADAMVDTLQVSADGPEPVSAFDVACSQGAIVLAQLRSGEWTVDVQGVSADTTQTWRSDPLAVVVNAQQTSSVDLILQCTQTGTDEACE